MSERGAFEAIRGDLMMVIEYCETQTYIERGSAMWDGLANLKRYAAARATQAVPALTDEIKRIVADLEAGGEPQEALDKLKSLLAAAPQPSTEQENAAEPVLTMDEGEVRFLSARLRRLFNHFNYPLPEWAKDDKHLIGIAPSCIGAVLANLQKYQD